MRIRKFIEIPEETLIRLAEGRFVKGSLHRDLHTGHIVFNAHKWDDRTNHRRQPDKLLIETDHGWVKESPKMIKYYCAVKKSLGVAKVGTVMAQDQKLAMSELMGIKLNEYMNLTDKDIVDRV